MVDLVCKTRTVRVELKIALKQTHLHHAAASGENNDVNRSSIPPPGRSSAIGTPASPTLPETPLSSGRSSANNGGSAVASDRRYQQPQQAYETVPQPHHSPGASPHTPLPDQAPPPHAAATPHGVMMPEAVWSTTGEAFSANLGSHLDARLIGGVVCCFLVAVYCCGIALRFYRSPFIGLCLATALFWWFQRLNSLHDNSSMTGEAPSLLTVPGPAVRSDSAGDAAVDEASDNSVPPPIHVYDIALLVGSRNTDGGAPPPPFTEGTQRSPRRCSLYQSRTLLSNLC